jgi:glycosyltransferase involved in cell wall biosynthesis
MHIAQVAPLYESVPPRGYGGTERVVAYLTDELLRRGHHVTLFASGDSVTRAELVACSPSALRLAKVADPLAYHVCMLDEVRKRAREFDIIHSHADYLAYPFLGSVTVPSVTTLHGRLDLPDLVPVYEHFSRIPLVSISDSQRRPFPAANWVRTVYHGLPVDELTFQRRPEGYLAFLGRVSHEKRVDRAIEIAIRVGLPLKIAAKIDHADREYFEGVVKPLLGHPLIEFVGEIDAAHKNGFLGGACATLFPIDWPEPFGLVMIESMACGTPVVAFRAGSVGEIMKDGVSGFVVNSIEEAVAATRRIPTIDRALCRHYFETRFSVETMADAYLDVYNRVIGGTISPGTLLAGPRGAEEPCRSH